MFNNRKYINKLRSRIEFLEKDIESKENTVISVLDANKELSQENEHLRNKIDLLEKVIKQHKENECRLNTKLLAAQSKLDKLEKYIDEMEVR